MTARSRIVDSVCVLVGVGLVLSVLDDSYTARSTYLLAGLLPAATLLGLALLLRTREGGGGLFCVLAALLYAPLAAVVALHDPGPYLVPTPEAMARALGGTVSGPLELVSTLPPVDADGLVLMVPFVVGFFAGGGSAWLALASVRAIAPVLPLLAGLAVAIALGSLVPDGLVARAAAMAAMVVWWVSVRARRLLPAASAERGAIGQAVAAALVVATVSAAVVVLVPDDDETDRVLLRGALAPAIDASDLTDPIQPESRLTDPQLLLRTTGVPDGSPVRFATLDEYTDGGWVAAGESPGAGPTGQFQRVGPEITPLLPGPQVGMRIRVQPAYVSDWLPTVGELTSLDLDYTDGRTQLSEVRYNQATGTAFVIGGVDPRDDYTFTAVVNPDELEPGADPARASAAQRQPAGDFLDPYLARWAPEGADPMTAWRGFLRYLARNGSVRLRATATDLDTAQLQRVLAPPRIVGTPHQYAAIAALGASRLGIPGRIVVGAEPDRLGRVHSDDVTSWVEVQVEDGSWRRVEPDLYLGTRSLEGTGGAAGGGEGGAGTIGPGTPIDEDDLEIPKGSDVDIAPGTPVPSGASNTRRVLVWTSVSVLGLIATALLLVPLVKLVRRRSRRARRSWSVRYVGGWQEVVDAARDVGSPVPEHLGRVPQARLLGSAAALARATDSAIFSREQPPAAEEETFWGAVAEARSAILADVSARRRIWAWFNPASLLASWRRRRAARHVPARTESPQPEPAAR
jgi:hypothetical protein